MVIKEAHTFISTTLHGLEQRGISIDQWEIDHLCYRTTSLQNYQEIKTKFSSIGQCLTESDVNGRPIATYKLHKPILFKERIIDLIEVPAPKKGKVVEEGFEHLEVVIDESFSEFISRHPHINFKTKGIEKDLNPELVINLEKSSVKFHHKSLEHIINIENSSLVMQFLTDTKILKILKEFTPCISGSLPLNIQTVSSDLDILFQTNDFNRFHRIIEEVFSHFPNFSQKMARHQDQESSICNFLYHGLKIQLFAQSLSVFKQQANQHFLIEGRLIKIHGEILKKQIQVLKESGIQTEPAFGEVFNLKDPYLELIKLNKSSDIELLKLL